MNDTTNSKHDNERTLRSPWLTVAESALYMRVSEKQTYREIASGRLRAARVGGRRQLRLRIEWLDEYLEACATVTAG